MFKIEKESGFKAEPNVDLTMESNRITNAFNKNFSGGSYGLGNNHEAKNANGLEKCIVQ